MADVSLATVSRVINNSYNVRGETKRRVEEAIKELGYKTNEYARGLAIKKTANICIISNANFLQYNEKIIRGMMDVAKIYDYNIYLHTVSRGISEMDDIIDSVVKRRIDGVIIFKGHFSSSELDKLEEYDIPTVIIGTQYNVNYHEKVGNVFIDFKKLGFELAIRYLEQGMDDICFVRDHINTSVSAQIIEGIGEAFKQFDKEFKDVIVYQPDEKSSYLPLSTILEKRNPAKLMITVRDSHAFSIINTFEKQGLVCPEDYEIVNILDSKYLNMFRPKISSYGIPEYDMGAIGCRLLTKMLDGDFTEKQMELSYFLLDRDTTKK